MVIKLPISVRDGHLLLAQFSKNQVYIHVLCNCARSSKLNFLPIVIRGGSLFIGTVLANSKPTFLVMESH